MGQRIFHFPTPAKLQVINKQQEFNIHDIKLDANRSSHKGFYHYLAKLLDVSFLFQIFWFVWCLIIPFGFGVNIQIRRWLNACSVPVMSLWLGYLFVINYFIAKFLGMFNTKELNNVNIETQS